MTETPEHHTAAGWAKRPRRLEQFTVVGAKDCGDGFEIRSSTGWTFYRSKSDLGRDIAVGETLWQETVQLTRITGLRGHAGGMPGGDGCSVDADPARDR